MSILILASAGFNFSFTCFILEECLFGNFAFLLLSRYFLAFYHHHTLERKNKKQKKTKKHPCVSSPHQSVFLFWPSIPCPWTALFFSNINSTYYQASCNWSTFRRSSLTRDDNRWSFSSNYIKLSLMSDSNPVTCGVGYFPLPNNKKKRKNCRLFLMHKMWFSIILFDWYVTYLWIWWSWLP